MNHQRLAIVLSALNLLLLGIVLSQVPTKAKEGVQPMLRTRAIELVDESGKIRAQLNVEPGGEVVFRLRDANGTIRTKLGAGKTGSGLVLMDDRTEPTIQLRAHQAGGNIILIDRSGAQQVIK